MPPRLRLLCPLVALAALLALSPPAAAHEPSLKVVATGLDNPRGIDLGRSGSVYVAEGGRGGAGPCIGSPEEGGEVCVGATGAITKIWHGGQRRIVTGLPSIAGEGGAEALGPQDISLLHYGGALIAVGLGGDPALRAELGPVGPGFGKLYKLSSHGHVRPVADIAGFEATANPDGGEIDSNPSSVVTRHGKTAVVDAGGNSLVSVGYRGKVRTLATFPFQPTPAGIPDAPPEFQPVPTSVVVGPDGALYVSELTGFPFPVGAADIYRVVPGHTPEIYASGFTNVTDLGFDRHGNLYVLEIATNGLLSGDPTGALKKVRRDGSTKTVVGAGLEAPYGLAISRKGDIYISNHSTEAGAGEVVRVRFGH